ncbi:MAG: DegT/DnrJ/EryC1/StrS family aminotransferase [Candidatus Woesearchaeota archaeon]|jgi:hypothetical protein
MNDKSNDKLLELTRNKLEVLVKKEKVFFTRRCNKSIDLAFKIAIKKLDDSKERFLLIQKEGGWITYQNYAKKYKLTLVRLDNCMLSNNNGSYNICNDRNDKNHDEENNKENCGKIKEIIQSNAILIMHSMPGYSFMEDMLKVQEKIKGKNIILINDCCGSIGTFDATIGDIIVCSFGEAKPLSSGGGGFIALNYVDEEEILLEEENSVLEQIDFPRLNDSINNLAKKRSFWDIKSKKVKDELENKGFNIINLKNEGINVLVAFNSLIEKERLIKYCEDKNLEYVECPRYIRTLNDAISIEIKREKIN